MQNVPFHSQIHLLSSTKKILADNQCLVSVFIHFKFSPDIFFPLHYMVKLINTFLVQVFFFAPPVSSGLGDMSEKVAEIKCSKFSF